MTRRCNPRQRTCRTRDEDDLNEFRDISGSIRRARNGVFLGKAQMPDLRVAGMVGLPGLVFKTLHEWSLYKFVQWRVLELPVHIIHSVQRVCGEWRNLASLELGTVLQLPCPENLQCTV